MGTICFSMWSEKGIICIKMAISGGKVMEREKDHDILMIRLQLMKNGNFEILPKI